MKLSDRQTIRCRCGALRGELAGGAKFTRVVCYCRDCQAYARALGAPEKTLDANGGSDIVASLQQFLRIDGGYDRLACLSLTERGMLRWYASCCNTAVANTLRDPKLSYMGLVSACLGPDARSLDAALGPATVAYNTESAIGSVPGSAWRTMLPTARILGRVVRARLDGSWRQSPFFDAAGRPVAARRILNAQPR